MGAKPDEGGDTWTFAEVAKIGMQTPLVVIGFLRSEFKGPAKPDAKYGKKAESGKKPSFRRHSGLGVAGRRDGSRERWFGEEKGGVHGVQFGVADGDAGAPKTFGTQKDE